jgi:hypothetical protein
MSYKIERVEALSEPIVDRSEKIASLTALNAPLNSLLPEIRDAANAYPLLLRQVVCGLRRTAVGT